MVTVAFIHNIRIVLLTCLNLAVDMSASQNPSYGQCNYQFQHVHHPTRKVRVSWPNFLAQTQPSAGWGLGTRQLLNIVSSPDQIFRARPAALSKNRVWTLSPQKLGQV